MRKLRKDGKQRGQAMVEFALILPLLLIVMFIIVDFGFGFSKWVIVTNAAREGARFGAIGAPLDQVVARTVETSNGILTAADVEAAYIDRNGNAAADRGDHVAVRATHNYQLLTPLEPLLKLTGFSPIPLSACTDMRLEITVAGATAGGGGC